MLSFERLNFLRNYHLGGISGFDSFDHLLSFSSASVRGLGTRSVSADTNAGLQRHTILGLFDFMNR